MEVEDEVADMKDGGSGGKVAGRWKEGGGKMERRWRDGRWDGEIEGKVE